MLFLFLFVFLCFYLRFYFSQYSTYRGFNEDLQLCNFSSVELSIRQKVLQRSLLDRKGYRGHGLDLIKKT